MITSTKNRQVTSATKLKKRTFRERERRFLVEGAQAVTEALEAGALEVLFHVPGAPGRADAVAERARGAGVRSVGVSEEVGAHLSSAVTPQGLVGVAGFLDVGLDEVGDGPVLVPVLCAVRDPGNAGTILRSARAAGADAVVFTEDSVDCYNEKTVRASAGSLFHLPVIRRVPAAETVGALRSRGIRILAAEATANASLYEADLARPTAFLLGNEAWGLPEDVRSLADGSVRIPLAEGAESLNLAAAAAVLLFEAARQRRESRGTRVPGVAAAIAAGAHDLRSPFTGITGFGGLLYDEWERFDEDKRRQMLGGMTVDAERAAALVHLLVDAGRSEEGALQLSIGPVELAEMARQVGAVFSRSADHPRVEIEGSASASADPDRIRSVLLVLCDVAARVPAESPVRIRVKRGTRTAVSIERAGSRVRGEADELLTGPAEGGPPGPWLARIIARAHGGEVSVEATDGLRFVLELPSA